MTIVAIIVTAIVWYLGFLLGTARHGNDEFANLFAILTMGAFVLEAIKRKR